MTDRELRKLSRAELLEMLLLQSKTVEQLQDRVAQLEKQLQDQIILEKNAGSIAEASLQLSAVFAEAQRSADIYLANVKRLEQDGEQRLAEAERIYADAQAKCGALEAETQTRCRAMEEETREKCEKLLSSAEEKAGQCWTNLSRCAADINRQMEQTVPSLIKTQP